MTKKLKMSFVGILAAFVCLAIILGVVLFAPVSANAEDLRVLTLNKLEDFNTEIIDGKTVIPNGTVVTDFAANMDTGEMTQAFVEDWFKSESVYDYRAIASSNNIDLDDIKNISELLFEDENGNETTVFPYMGIMAVVKNGFSESALRTLLGAEESATYNEMMTSILTGKATYAYDRIEIEIPAEITYVGDFAFSLAIFTYGENISTLGFGSYSRVLLESMAGAGFASNISLSENLPSISKFGAALTGRTENLTSGFGVLGMFGNQTLSVDNSISLTDTEDTILNLEGFTTVGYQFGVASTYKGNFTLGSTVERINSYGVMWSTYKQGEHDSLGKLVYERETVSIPASLKIMGEDCLYNLSPSLSADASAYKLEYIGDRAFKGQYTHDVGGDVSGVSGDLVLPDTLTYIGESAFADTNITSVYVPSSVTFIGESAFGGCESLTSVALYANVTELSRDAFDSRNINTLYIPGVGHYAQIDHKTLSTSTSYQNNKLTQGDIYVEAADGQAQFNGKSYELLEGKLVIPEGVTHIGDLAFENYKKITELCLPESVETIGKHAFCGAEGITKITFEDKLENGKVVGVKSNLKSIGETAFYGLHSLTELIVPQSVTTISGRKDQYWNTLAFGECNNLTVIYNLSSLDITAGSNSYGGVAANVAVICDSYDGTSVLQQFGDYKFIETDKGFELFSYNGNGGSITLPATYKGQRYSLYQYAFRDNDNITEIIIADNTVTDIGEYAFYNCTALKKAVIGVGVENVSAYAFAGCTELKNVLITSGLQIVGEGAFMDCSSLTEITLQNSLIAEIGASAFENCSSLLAIYIPDTVVTVGAKAYKGCTSAEELYIGSNVEALGYQAFAYTSSLSDAAIPDNVTVLVSSGVGGSIYNRDELFAYSGIKSVYVGSGIERMNNTFSNCLNLTDVTFSPDCKVKEMVEAFRKCNSLHKFTVPESVTDISGLFFEAQNIYELRLSSNVEFLKYVQDDEYKTGFSSHSLFTTGRSTPHLTVYFPEITDENRATYGKNFVSAMLMTAYAGQAYDYQFNRGFLLDVNFVAPNKEAYDLINAEIYDVNNSEGTYPPGLTKPNYIVKYYTEWFVKAYARTFNGQWHCYQTINQTTSVTPSVTNDVRAPQDRLYYLQDVTYEVRKSDGTLLSSQTETKLARTPSQEIIDSNLNGYYVINSKNNTVSGNWRFLQGADLRYVRCVDSESGAVYFAIDENYSLPTRVGAYKTSDNWVVGTYDGSTKVNTADLSKMLVSGATTYVNILDDSDKIIIEVPGQFDMIYSGNGWTLPDEYKGIVEVVSVNGENDADAVAVGSYEIKLRIADAQAENYQFADGTEATVNLVISKRQAQLVWIWNGVEVKENGAAVKIYDGKSVSEELKLILKSLDGEILNTYYDATFMRKKDGVATNSAAIDVGEWTLSIAQSYLDGVLGGYDIVNSPMREFRIAPIEIIVNDSFVGALNWTANGLSLKNGVVYIYSDGTCSNREIAGKTLVEIKEFTNGIADFVDADVVIEIAQSGSEYDISYSNNVGRDKDSMYSATAVLSAAANYVFVMKGVTLPNVAVSVENGKLTIVKEWCIISIDNKLVNADGSVWNINDWTFGEGTAVSMPKLQHGANVSFELKLTTPENKTIVLDKISLGELSYYINASMPAGKYVLTASVGVNLDDSVVYPAYNQDYGFTVAAADIKFDLQKDENGYAFYKWNGTQTVDVTPDKSLFFKEFVSSLTGKITLAKVTPQGHWATSAAQDLFGNYTLTYNLLRMHNASYSEAGEAKLTDLIVGGSTYTVYFQITAPNHNGLTAMDNERFGYFFKVIAYVDVAVPTVANDGLVYTGSKVQPEIAESELYEVVWNSNDSYVTGGQHSVSFRLYDSVHYRWKNTDEDTVSVNFTIAKADNVFTVALNMLGWSYETFDAAVNNIRATTRYLDNGQSIRFRVVKKGQTVAAAGLEDFTVDENGKVNGTVAAALNALKVGEYILYAKVNGTNNYNELERNVSFAVAKTVNAWASGEDDLVLPSWIAGKFSLDENRIVVKAAHGEALIQIRDMDGNVYYDSLKPEENTLNTLDVGKYLLVAWVEESEDFAALAERSFTIEVLEKIGLPWWGTMTVVLGALGLAAAIILVLWKLKVFEILTDKISLAITTRATVDATIAAVRAVKTAEEAEAHVNKVKARERLEAAREAQRNKTPEQRAQELVAKAEVTATKADKMHEKASKMRERADKLAGRTEQINEAAAEQPDETSKGE